MPCPLFVPEASSRDPRDFHRGACAADPQAAPGDDMLRRLCNRGYARAQCELAARSDADATSFFIKAIHADSVEVAWAVERNHHPVEVGLFRIVKAAATEAGPLERQARAYAGPVF